MQLSARLIADFLANCIPRGVHIMSCCGSEKTLSRVLRNVAAALPLPAGAARAKDFYSSIARQTACARRQFAEGRLPAQPEHRLHALLRPLRGLCAGADRGQRVRAEADACEDIEGERRA